MRKRTVLGTFGGTAVVGALLAGTLSAGALDGATPDDPPPAPVAARSGLIGFESCAQLRAWYVAQGLREVGAYGWGGDLVYAATGQGTERTGTAPVPVAGVEKGSLGEGVGGSATGTNTQEAGVDEPDVAKTNGSLLAAVIGDRVLISDVSGAQPRRLASYPLPASMPGAELLLAGERLVVIGSGPGGAMVPLGSGPEPRPGRTILPGAPDEVRVLTLDLSDPADPAKVADQIYRGSMISVRQYGDTIRLVTRLGAPNLRFVLPRPGVLSQAQALRKNRQVVRQSRVSDWLASVREPGQGDSTPLLDCTQVLHPDDPSGTGTISVLGFDPRHPEDRSATAVTASGDLVYSSTDQLFVATTDSPVGLVRPLGPRPFTRQPAPRTPRTEVHAFDLDRSGPGATYVASGSVTGTLRDRWSLDAYDGSLRLALQTGAWLATDDGASRAGANAIVTMTRAGNRLVQTGRVDGLGAGEEIKSVRWFDDLAVLVTFRQLDPLYTVDLSEPAHPRLLGELKIPGFSGYLHPIGEARLLGLGTNADRRGRAVGALASVFDLSDLAHPRQLDRVGFGRGSYLTAPDDPRAFTWLPATATGWTPIGSWSEDLAGTRLLRIGVDDAGRLSTRTMFLRGVPPDGPTRVLPLPGDRVLVVSGGQARTLPG